MDKNVSTCYATATKWTMYVYENVKAMKFIALENVNFKTRMTDLIDWWFLYVNSKCHEENKPEFLSSKAESIAYFYHLHINMLIPCPIMKQGGHVILGGDNVPPPLVER